MTVESKSLASFFGQIEAKSKPIAPWTCDFSVALSKLQVMARNSDWFSAFLFVIGRSNYFGFVFFTVI